MCYCNYLDVHKTALCLACCYSIDRLWYCDFLLAFELFLFWNSWDWLIESQVSFLYLNCVFLIKQKSFPLCSVYYLKSHLDVLQKVPCFVSKSHISVKKTCYFLKQYSFKLWILISAIHLNNSKKTQWLLFRKWLIFSSFANVVFKPKSFMKKLKKPGDLG